MDYPRGAWPTDNLPAPSDWSGWRPHRWEALLGVLLALGLAGPVLAQQRRPVPAARPAPAADTTRQVPRRPTARPLAKNPGDTARVAVADTTINLRGRKRRDIETTIKYTARDSIRLDAPNKIAYLYGDARIDYGQTSLLAERVAIDYGTNLVTAEGAPDSTGEVVGTPIFTDKGEQYEATKIAYNFKTKKGKITETVTKQGDGYVHAEAVRRQSETELYGLHGQYTTCNLAHPHFYIAASRMKVVPGDKIVTGPFNLVVADIPTPLGFLFGFFPTPRKRASGVIIPSYGESTRRGFYLQNGGYYWVASPSVGVKFTGDIYSLGGYTARSDVTYLKRYRYSGTFQVSYLRNSQKTNTNTGADLNPVTEFPDPDAINIQWSHTPVRRPGGGEFSASVNAGSVGFYRGQVNTTTQNFLSNTLSSSVRYSKQLTSLPINYTIAANQSQSTGGATGQSLMTFDLPQVTVGLTRQTPLHWLARRTGKRVFDNLTLGYSLTGGHSFSTVRPAGGIAGLSASQIVGAPTEARNLTLRSDGLGKILNNGNTTVNHAISIGLGTYSLAHINFSPGVTYGEAWTFRKFSYAYDADSGKVRVDTTGGLHRVYQYSYNLGASTQIYGLMTFPKSWKVQAIRSQLNPSVTYSYSPNYADAAFGYYQNNVRIDEAGTVRNLPRYAGAPSGGRSSVLGFSLSDVIAMKVRPSKRDTATELRKVQLLQISASTGYNLLADSLKLGNISVNGNTKLFGLFDINASATLNPYQRDTAGRLLDRYLVEAPGRRLTRLDNLNLNVRFSFNPAQRNLPAGQRPVTPPGPNAPLDQTQPLQPSIGALIYYDYLTFQLPWTLNMAFGLNYRDPGPKGPTIGQQLLTKSLTVDGTLKLTTKWNVTYSGGFDFTSKKLVTPNLGIVRDLHCWQLSVNWRPTGQLQSYVVTISPLSAMLQDLKLERRRQYFTR